MANISRQKHKENKEKMHEQIKKSGPHRRNIQTWTVLAIGGQVQSASSGEEHSLKLACSIKVFSRLAPPK